MEKVGIIVDVNSVYHGAKTAINGVLCYQTLVRNITRNRQLENGIAIFNGNTSFENPGFSALLRDLGLKIKFAGALESVSDMIANTIISMGNDVDTIVVVSDNPALGPIFDYLEIRNRGVKAELWFFDSLVNDTVRDDYDVVVNLDNTYLFKKS